MSLAGEMVGICLQVLPCRRSANSQATPRDFACWQNIAVVFEPHLASEEVRSLSPFNKSGAQKALIFAQTVYLKDSSNGVCSPLSAGLAWLG